MANRLLTALAVLALGYGPAAAQETGKPDAAKAKVQVTVATEHVPEGLKAGDRVDLTWVSGKAATATGRVSYMTRPIVLDVAIVSVTRVETPKAPEQAVQVELLVPKDQAAKVEQFKTRLVTVSESVPGAPPRTTKKPVPLRLERPKTDTK